LLNGEVVDLAFTDGIAHDNSYKLGKSKKIEMNGLYIRDLGYFDTTYFNQLEIAILLTLHIQNKLGQFLWAEEEFEISPIKAAKLIKKNLAVSWRHFYKAKVKCLAGLKNWQNLFIKEQKRNRVN